MIKLGENARNDLIALSIDKDIFIEGNILKILEDEGDVEFKQYLRSAIEKDKESRRKRLEITKQVQTHNKELIEAQRENEKLMEEIKDALHNAEEAKNTAENAKKAAESDLDLLQKKTQFELIGRIVKVALAIILGVGIITTILYIVAIIVNRETALIGNTWSSMFGILLTNSFSIIGTIMGIKYASDGKNAFPVGNNNGPPGGPMGTMPGGYIVQPLNMPGSPMGSQIGAPFNPITTPAAPVTPSMGNRPMTPTAPIIPPTSSPQVPPTSPLIPPNAPPVPPSSILTPPGGPPLPPGAVRT